MFLLLSLINLLYRQPGTVSQSRSRGWSRRESANRHSRKNKNIKNANAKSLIEIKYTSNTKFNFKANLITCGKLFLIDHNCFI